MKTLKKLTTYLPVIFLAWLLSSCGGGVEGIDIKMNIPITVNTNEEFVTQITVTNTLNNSQTLLSIDIGDNYLEGIALLKTEPNFTEQMHIPIDNSVSYSFGKEIGPQESITIDLYWKALSEGEFSDEIDFCINSDFSFISKGARTIVGGESGNTTTEPTTETNIAKEEGSSSSEVISVVDYQIDFVEGEKVKVYGVLLSMSIDLVYLYQLPEMMPFLTVDMSNLSKEDKRKILGCGAGCEVTIFGQMKSTDEIIAINLSSITEFDPEKFIQ